MEDLTNCTVVDFGSVDPGMKYKKKVNIKSDRMVEKVTRSPDMNPLEEVFTIKRDLKVNRRVRNNRFIVEFTPLLPHHKSFSYRRVEFVDGSVEYLFIKGATKGPKTKLSHSRIVFRTTTDSPASQFRFFMENNSNCYDVYNWDFVSKGSEIQITPMNGLIPAKSRMDFIINFEPRKIGLFYRPIACLLKFQEPLYVEVYGFHYKMRKAIDLEKYMVLNEKLPTYPTNYCRYISDCTPSIRPESKPTVSLSRRFIDFGSVVRIQGCNQLTSQEIFLTNHADKDLTVQIDSTDPGVFEAHPSKAIIPSNNGTLRIQIFFCPDQPELYYCGELHAALLWGLKLEYKVPYAITIHLVGDSFTRDSCGWSPSYSIEKTRIVLPGTVPGLPAYTAFQINRVGPLPILFQLQPVDSKETPLFVVKPTQGLIKQDFQLVIVQMLPSNKNDVIFQEEWYLIVNRFVKVKLEILGSCELPFIRVGQDKSITFPPTTMGSYFNLQVPVKNPTRLELEYHCLESLKPRTFSACQDYSVIGPGEQQFVDFQFCPQQNGHTHAPMGIQVAWAPYHSAAKKSLRGTSVQAETVVFLAGTAEIESIFATPKNVSMFNVLLNEWGVTHFFLHNSGNSTAYIRLDCMTGFPFAKIGPWELTPNDITLKPHHQIEIKLSLLGVERYYHIYAIRYKLFESDSFEKESSDPKELVTGDIYVSFPSLRVLDIRYEGLAKSLSKHFLWSLLQINRLNKILKNLETSSRHYSNMKLPEYQESSPTFVVEVLLKNNSPVTVCLEVDMKKNCPCVPKRADSISRRKFDHSCRHEDQMAASIRDPVLEPDQTTILRITAEYEVTDNCIFTMTLYVSATENRWRTSVRVEVERGIIAIDKSSLCFLHPKEFGTSLYIVHFEDTFLGDSSKYYQIIWLYNHSQLDCRYWSEWLFVNNKVFRLINDKAVVPAYSSRPLFVLFTPYELRTYVARLALINEAGDESHIQIEGRGTVNHEVGTERMRNQMPAASCFEEHEIGPDLELSTDHICVRPMPTHSFDSYLFFMKNTTTEHVIQFAWQRLVIWSTMKVMVVPKSGEIEPGEIFPVRVHIHTYRFPAVFNFAVECLYFRKCESEQYFEKSRLVTKVATIFDSSFVLEPDKQVEIAYRNPSLSAKAGKRAKNRIITIGGSVRIFNREFMAAMYPDLNSQLKCCPQQKLNVVSSSKFAGGLCANQFFGATEALQRILWDVVQDKNFQKSLQKERGPIRYIDYPDAGPKRRKIPGRQMAMLLSNLLESALMKLFGVEACLFHDTCKTIEGRRDSREKMLRVFNNYYENMLSTEIDTVCLIAPSANLPRRYQSRDNLAYVQRDT